MAKRIQPDTALTEQYLDTLRRTNHLDPERRLMLAILEDALTGFRKNVLERTKKESKVFRDAERWILGSNRNRLCSFESICTNLGIDGDNLRRKLQEWKSAVLENS